jgi:hypothetical protein
MNDKQFAQHLENLLVFVETGGTKCSPVVATWSIRKLAATRDMSSIEQMLNTASVTGEARK